MRILPLEVLCIMDEGISRTQSKDCCPKEWSDEGLDECCCASANEELQRILDFGWVEWNDKKKEDIRRRSENNHEKREKRKISNREEQELRRSKGSNNQNTKHPWEVRK